MYFISNFLNFQGEPEPKKMASIVADPLMGLGGGRGGGPMNSAMGGGGGESMGPGGGPGGPRMGMHGPPQSAMGGGSVCNEDIRVPDKMVGLSESHENKRKINERFIIKLIYTMIIYIITHL